ncbi:hypothetical protein K227x_12250 [Rubripirellula lacrimiformis]|uniref:Pilus formation protein N-terminal domain-containing protein n=1 Tax=Rubripirellula lacrimiformis TaxID=1930273 RepID=A0A517N6S2_9BACT|nr:pilus assembly protein N-terminal domain-containing protein [Rubripirellula lacrimiformis]QDT02846.1 hypothetical protein K227x_12250 [Rubripirellula lacrimiformis]
MRDQRTYLVNLAKRKRRAVLLALLSCGTPVLGGNLAFAADPLTMPPLPLHSATTVQDNPFCEPAPNASIESIRLASGGENNAVRLMPIGAAIGLKPVNSGQPRRVEDAAMTIEKPTEVGIRKNQLIGSAHHENNDLIDADIADVSPNPPASPSGLQAISNLQLPIAVPSSTATAAVDLAADPSQQSSIVLMPMTPMPVAAQQTDHEGDATDEPELSQVAQVEPVSVGQMHVAPIPTSMQSPAEVVVQHEEPVFFSFTDDNFIDEDAVSVAQEADPMPTMAIETPPQDAAPGITRPNYGWANHDEAGPDEASSNVSENAAAKTSPVIESISDSRSIKPSDIQPIVIDDLDKPLTAMEMDPGSDAKIIEPKRNRSVISVPAQQQNLSSKRYRPPVAVTAVPVSLGRDRSAQTAQVQSAISPIETIQAESKPTTNEKSVSLHLSQAQVRSLTFGGVVRNIEVSDRSVCQAFASGPNQLKLIGTGTGVTKLVVWAAPESAGESPRMRSFNIHVGQPLDASGSDAPDRSAMLNQSIQRVFPDADVVVHHRHDELVVTGRCGSEDSAKKIIRMVRKTCLVPVRDELVVR